MHRPNDIRRPRSPRSGELVYAIRGDTPGRRPGSSSARRTGEAVIREANIDALLPPLPGTLTAHLGSRRVGTRPEISLVVRASHGAGIRRSPIGSPLVNGTPEPAT